MKRSNIDAMICKQEEITDITREAINKIQLDKLNAVLKKEKERQGFYRDLPERLESLADLKPSLYNGIRPCSERGQDVTVLPGRNTEDHFRTDKWNNRCR